MAGMPSGHIARRARLTPSSPCTRAGAAAVAYSAGDCVSDYHLHVERTRNCLSQWEWRILQRSRGIGRCGTGFTTEEAARRYGEIALQKFIADPALVPSNAGK